MPDKPPSLPVRARAAGALERIDPARWAELQRIAETLRSLGTAPLTRARAEELGERLGVHAGSVYRYGRRLVMTDELTSVAGRTRGWKPERARLSPAQADAIDAAIETLRRRPGRLRLVDLVEEVNARCRVVESGRNGR